MRPVGLLRRMSDLYLSTDIETDGPVPGLNSMLSLGSAAYSADKRLLATFSVNLHTLADASADPETEAWWATQPEAWQACRLNPESPQPAMLRYVAWIKSLGGTPIFVAYPVVFDFAFVYTYLMRFAGENPFGYRAVDVRSYAMAVLKADYPGSSKKHMPQEWFDPLPHTHVALDDALEQGALFCNMLKANRTG